MKRERTSEKVCLIGDTKLASSLATNARFSCGKCGAKAHDAINLCDPVQFSKAG